MQEQSLAEKRAAAKGARYDPDTIPAPLPHTSPSATAGELELEG